MEISVVKSFVLVVNQLVKFYDGVMVEIMIDQVVVFWVMYIYGRVFNGLLFCVFDDEVYYCICEGEIVVGLLVGWNFGEGYLYNEQLVVVVQWWCNFVDGDLWVIIFEGQFIYVQKQWYCIVDVKIGLFEVGYVMVEDMLSCQLWFEFGDEFLVYVMM